MAQSPLAPNQRFDQQVNTFIVDNLPGIDDAEAAMLSRRRKWWVMLSRLAAEIQQLPSPRAFGSTVRNA